MHNDFRHGFTENDSISEEQSMNKQFRNGNMQFDNKRALFASNYIL